MHPLQSDSHLIVLKRSPSHITTFPSKIQAPFFLQKTLCDLPSCLSSCPLPNHWAPIAYPPLPFYFPAPMFLPASQPSASYLDLKAQFVSLSQEASFIHSFLPLDLGVQTCGIPRWCWW